MTSVFPRVCVYNHLKQFSCCLSCVQVSLTPPTLETSVRPGVNCHDYSSISKWITIKHLTYTRARRLTELPCILLLTSHPSCRGQILPARLLGLLWSLRCRGRRRGPWSRPDQTPLCGLRLLRNLLPGNKWGEQECMTHQTEMFLCCTHIGDYRKPE